jgi:hypothetical protein
MFIGPAGPEVPGDPDPGNGNTSALLGLRFIGPAESEVPGVLAPGLIIIGGGLLQGALDPDESPTSHLEFGSGGLMAFVGLFGFPPGKGPFGVFGTMGVFGLNGDMGLFCVFGIWGEMGDKGPVGVFGITGEKRPVCVLGLG